MIQRNLFPDLFLIEDKSERKRVWREAIKPVSGSARYLGLLVVGMLVAQTSGGMLVMVLAEEFGKTKVPLWFDIPIRFFLSVLGALFPIWLMRRRITKDIRQYLNQNGFQLCVACGYDLRGQVEWRCPECGAAFDQSDRSSTDEALPS